MPLAHLDRPFDYAVPATMADTAVPGCRVKVRFAGQDVDGYVVARAATTDHQGRLAPLRRVVSAEPVLSPEVAALTADVAARYAGTRSDVLRLAVPARHATTEKQPGPPAPGPSRTTPRPAPAAWRDHEPGAAFLRHLADGGARARSGRRARRPTGRACWRTRRPRRTPRAAVRCSACPTARTSPGSTRR